MPTSRKLNGFLRASDLDDALRAARALRALTVEDEAAIRTVISEWRDPQAISNLLFHPSLIPPDLRLPTLFRGLDEERIPYYVLAAVVGLQSLDPKTLADTERRKVVTQLLTLVEETDDIIAARASLALQEFAEPEDVPRVFALVEHPGEVVRHNLRAWLFRTLRAGGVDALTGAAEPSGMASETRRRLLDEFEALLDGPPDRLEMQLGCLAAYIPNLEDVQLTDEPDQPGSARS